MITVEQQAVAWAVALNRYRWRGGRRNPNVLREFSEFANRPEVQRYVQTQGAQTTINRVKERIKRECQG